MKLSDWLKDVTCKGAEGCNQVYKLSGIEILRSRSSLAVVAGMKKPE